MGRELSASKGRVIARAVLCLALAACPGGGGEPARPGSGSGSGSAVVVVPVDAPEASQEERLAAIQKAMNELDEAAQACWAAAAVVRFDIEGEIVAMIEISSDSAKVSVARDTANNKQLAACLVQLLSRYPWAPPLHGQAIQLPFKFRAPPGGQNVVDRALVPWAAQGKIAVAVLLDALNSGNDDASLLEIAIQNGGSTGARRADRAELWMFLHDAKVSGIKVLAGDMMFVDALAVRDVVAERDMHAVIAMVPGGREGSARAGALPTRETDGGRHKKVHHLPAANAKSYCLGGGAVPCTRGKVTIFAEPSTIKEPVLAASVIELPPNAAVPEHVHAKETELLYVLAGSGTLTVAGVPLAVTATSVVQIPPNTKHAFTATTEVRAVQIYSPAGPEQRFKAKP